MSELLPAFGRYPEEGRLIGELIAGYGELEFSLAHLVGHISGNSDVTFKVMFRARGEEQRINVGDAMARPLLSPGNFRDHYERTISGLRHCLKIRNQYAHCQFGDDSARGLWFVALEEIAKENKPYDLAELTQTVIPVDLLNEQANYFVFVERSLGYLNHEWRFRAGKLSNQPVPRPPAIPKPPLQGP
jgi:hypothetical protein